MSPKLRAHGSELHGPSKPRWPITSDLRQEPGALAAHAGICAGGSGVTCPPTATLQPPEIDFRLYSDTDILAAMSGIEMSSSGSPQVRT